MSGTSYLTVAGGGSTNLHSGVLSVPSTLGTTVNSLLQTYLDGVSGSVAGGSAGFENLNAIGTGGTVAGSGSTFLEEITNSDSTGASVGGTFSGVVSVNPAATTLVVQYPGNLSLSGSSGTNLALFGAASNVNYTVSGGSGASIVAAGGNDAFYISNASDAVTFAGNDTVVFTSGTSGAGNETVNAVGNATTSVFIGGSDAATVTASDSAQASVVFLPRAGGNLDFINNSSSAQTVFSGLYTVSGGGTEYTSNSITVFGGAGGGFYVGGSAGFNSLNGGTGNSTLVGGGGGDILSTGGANNVLFSGNGSETLIGGGGTNSFFLGVEDVGIGTIRAVGDLASATGSGSQNFILGQLSATTLTGSTVTGASNVYDVLGTYTTTGGQAVTLGGSDFTITDFGANSTINLLNGSFNTGAGAPSVETVQPAIGGGSTQILLNDGTVITLKGVSTSQVSAPVGGHSITFL
ncbi:MAG: hypothetical protein KGJ73_01020 [Rhodospirillales bacterium]|nr:hypothetical protein [Rhodospirillales bacterium]